MIIWFILSFSSNSRINLADTLERFDVRIRDSRQVELVDMQADQKSFFFNLMLAGLMLMDGD